MQGSKNMEKQNSNKGSFLLRSSWGFIFEGEFECICTSGLIVKSLRRKKGSIVSNEKYGQIKIFVGPGYQLRWWSR